jgi:ABC-2 type transport system permease protein
MTRTVTSDLRLAGWQVLEEQRLFWRNRQAAVFGFVMPLMLLVVFATLNHGANVTIGHHSRSYVSFFIPGILSYGLVTVGFMNLAMGTVALRETGILKRMRGTPLPAWAYLGGRVGSQVIAGLALAALTLALAVVAYGVRLPGAAMVGFTVTLIVGICCLTALALGLTRFIRDQDAARPVSMLIVLPLTFVSGIWYPIDGLPHWLQVVAGDLPLRPLADGLQHAFAPAVHGTAIVGHDLLVLAIWTLIGIRLTARALRAQAV